MSNESFFCELMSNDSCFASSFVCILLAPAPCQDRLEPFLDASSAAKVVLSKSFAVTFTILLADF
jgi:hypothetical protein